VIATYGPEVVAVRDEHAIYRLAVDRLEAGRSLGERPE